MRSWRPKIEIMFVTLAALAGCVRSSEEAIVPALTSVEIARLIPERVKDRGGWARDVRAAFEVLPLEPTRERVCAVLSLIEQESGYQADPRVANLPQIVRAGLEDKLAVLGPLAGPAAQAILAGKAPHMTTSFARRVETLATERDLDRLFRDVADAYRGRLPPLFAKAAAVLDELNPVTTIGSMQVKVGFARTLDAFAALGEAELREVLYTRGGGIRAGVARLFGYEAGYGELRYRFADYNAGVYASRNAAFQEQLGDLLGRPLALDGDLLAYDKRGKALGRETESLAALRAFGRARGHWDWTIERAAAAEKSPEFEKTSLWHEVRSAWQRKNGRAPAYARLPEVTISSAKLAKTRSTRWFAQSVERRYRDCRAR